MKQYLSADSNCIDVGCHKGEILDLILPSQTAATAAPAISSMMIYLLMALVLAIKPQGLFPPKGVGR